MLFCVFFVLSIQNVPIEEGIKTCNKYFDEEEHINY